MKNVREANVADMRYMANRLRKADVDEIRAASGYSPLAALLYSYEVSSRCRVFCPSNDKPVVVYGVTHLDTSQYPEAPPTCIGWMLATPEVTKYSRFVAKESKRQIDELQGGYSICTNFVDVRNKLHRRWCGLIGFFEVQTISKFGHEQRPFVQVMRSKDV